MRVRTASKPSVSTSPLRSIKWMLAPILAKTPQQQADFLSRYDAWRDPAIDSRVGPVKAPPGPAAKIARRGRPWPIIAAVLAVVLLLTAAVYYLIPPPPEPISEDAAESTPISRSGWETSGSVSRAS